MCYLTSSVVSLATQTNQISTNDEYIGYLYWSNLGVNSYKDLTIFNPKFTKNIAHFDAPNYDLVHEERVNIAAKYIPFASQVRTMLDIRFSLL